MRAAIEGERRAIRRSSANVMRSLPRRLASYSAASAACSRSRRSLPSPGQLATPNDSVSRQPPRSMPARLRCRRRQTVRALAFVVSGSSSANSSPPMRKTLSAGRMPRRRSAPTSRSASSPATCPRVSLSSLKSSMSARTRAKPAERAATSPRIVSWKLRWLASPVRASVAASASLRSKARRLSRATAACATSRAESSTRSAASAPVPPWPAR